MRNLGAFGVYTVQGLYRLCVDCIDCFFGVFLSMFVCVLLLCCC